MSEDGSSTVPFEPATPVQPEQSVQSDLTPGAQLARQRIALGWSISEVASHLNLAPRQVQAMEDDNHAALPGIAITRGFIRAYAKLLRIDAAPLMVGLVLPVENFSDTPAPARRTVAPANFSDNRLGSSGGHRASSKWYSILLVGVVVIAAGSLAQHYGWLPKDLETASANVSNGLSVLRGEPVEAVATGPEPSPGHVEITPDMPIGMIPPADVPMDTDVPGGDSAAGPATVATAPVADATAAIPPVDLALLPAPATAINNKLVLNVRSDSWIEIRGNGSSAVTSKLYRAGSTSTFDIVEPVTLVVGNAAGVEATLRGAPLPLPSASNNNVARINVK
ncbi:MAG: cytoskeleton protein RodZ [Bradyrhizobium sp.]|jgi:cytoskeleton protein RodZ